MKIKLPSSYALLVIILCIVVLTFVLVVVQLTQFNESLENFQNDSNEITTDENEIKLAFFFAEWCGHCQKFKPEWAKAKESLNGKKNGNGKMITFVDIDCSDGCPLGEKYGVKGYPTIKIIKDNQENGDYEGERTSSGLSKFVSEL